MPEESSRGLTGFLSRLGSRKSLESPDPTAATPADFGPLEPQPPIQPTKALRKFLSMLSTRESPVLLDLGPVIGPNLNFFGETLGCKVFIEDLFADLERHLRAGSIAEFPAFLKKRLT